MHINKKKNHRLQHIFREIVLCNCCSDETAVAKGLKERAHYICTLHLAQKSWRWPILPACLLFHHHCLFFYFSFWLFRSNSWFAYQTSLFLGFHSYVSLFSAWSLQFPKNSIVRSLCNPIDATLLHINNLPYGIPAAHPAPPSALHVYIYVLLTMFTEPRHRTKLRPIHRNTHGHKSV